MIKPAFELIGRVQAVLVAADFGSILSAPCPKIQVICGHGIQRDKHAGARLADVRERDLRSFGLPKGMEIANHRHFSAVSSEELLEIGLALGLLTSIPFGYLGENLVLVGIPKLTNLPPGTMLFFRKDEHLIRTAVLVVWGENKPCIVPGKALQARFSRIAATCFPRAAMGRRGVVGSVYASGTIHAGDTVVVRVPSQRIYDPRE